MSRTFRRIFEAIGEMLLVDLFSGNPRITLLGCLIGILIGLTTFYLWAPLMLPGGAIGGLVGAWIGASLTKAPRRDEVAILPEELGNPLLVMEYHDDPIHQLIVALEKAIYTCSVLGVSNLADEALTALENGDVPLISGQQFIPYSKLLRLESNKSASGGPVLMGISYLKHGKESRCVLFFANIDQRDVFVANIERQLKLPLVVNEEPVDLIDGVLGSGMTLVFIVIPTALLAVLSARWTKFPPPFKQYGDRPDDLVGWLVAIGPVNIVIAGLIASCLPLAWMIMRIIQRPKKMIYSLK